MVDYNKVGAAFVTALFKHRMALFEMTHADYTRMKKVMTAHGRHLVQAVEDPVLREFIEEQDVFKPSPEEMQARQFKERMSDPETARQIAEMQRFLDDDYQDGVDLKDLKDD